MPRRKLADLKEKSVWDETLVSTVLPIPRHRNKMWHHLIYSFSTDPSKKLTLKSTGLHDVPYADWNFSKKSIEEIQSNFSLFTTRVVQRFDSARGDTIKLLVRLQDGHEVETVIMKHVTHNTVCISSQIGCQMGCKFCATGTMGIIGDLTAGEIVEQVVHANNIAKIRNVVFMGMGEPLNNYENVKLAVQFFTDSKRFSLSHRHVTVSTVGVLKAMYRLSDDLPFVNLALSLHAPNQEVRLKIVPTARAVSIEKLLEAVDYHIAKNSQTADSPSGEEKGTLAHPMDGNWKTAKSSSIMIEYILIRDINDRDEHAHELGALLSPRRGYVMLNLIPYNPTEVAEDFHPPEQEQVENFMRICMSPPYNIHTRVRQEKGQDIAGACGQLAVVNKRNTEGAGALPDMEDVGTSTTSASAAAVAAPASSTCDGHESDCGSGCFESKASSRSGSTEPGVARSPSRSKVVVSHGRNVPVGLKSVILGDMLDGLGVSSHLPVDGNREGVNISDNSPQQEHEGRSTIAKRQVSALLYINVAIALALGSYSAWFNRI